MVAPEDSVPQVDPDPSVGASPDAADQQAPAPTPAAPEGEATETTSGDAPERAAEGAAPPAEGEPSDAPQAGADTPASGDAQPSADAGDSVDADTDGPQDAGTASEGADDATTETSVGEASEQPAGDGQPTPEGEPQADAADGQQADGEQVEGGEGQAPAKKRRRSRGRRSGRGGASGPGGRRRFAWDEVFLRQRLELLRSMDPDAEAIAWAVDTAGRFDVADILAGEGSSGREFGRRAYGATPETEDQAAWIVLAAVRARDIVPAVRRAVSGTSDGREQVKAAIETLGIARVNPALQGERPAQQVFAERARRVDITVEGGEAQKAAWALLSLAKPQDVQYAAAPPRPNRPRTGGPGGPGGPGGRGGGWGGDDRRGRKREPGIPGGVFSVGESGIGGELGAKLRAALAEAEGKPETDTDTAAG